MKNIIIALLLLVNLFLLALILRDKTEGREIRRQVRENVQTVYAENGILLKAEVPWDAAVGSSTLYRDLTAEYDGVRAVLGKCSVQDLGGNILFYSSDKGEARFRGTGEFQLMPVAGEIPTGKDPGDTARSVLRSMGMETEPDMMRLEEDGQLITVSLTCLFRGDMAYNCEVHFIFSRENLLFVDGRRPMEYGGALEATGMDAATVLMRYLSEIRACGLVCSEVLQVEPGCVMKTSAAGDGSMTPFWRIVTDVGQSYVNGLTGKLESIV